jgi:hypothetical protein
MSERAEQLVDGYGPGIHVADDFCQHAEAVRLSALASGFGTWKPNKGEVGSSVYDGMNFWGDHAAMIKALTDRFGYAIAPNSMFFRITNADTELAYVHSDREMGKFTCIVYLSHHYEMASGTAFFRHKRTGATRMQSFEEMSKDQDAFAKLKDEMVRGSLDDWEMTSFVPGRFNRALLFEAPLYHGRVPRNGFGDTPEEGRMVWVCHFAFLQGIAT